MKKFTLVLLVSLLLFSYMPARAHLDDPHDLPEEKFHAQEVKQDEKNWPGIITAGILIVLFGVSGFAIFGRLRRKPADKNY